jgi:aspartyl protease family protein
MDRYAGLWAVGVLAAVMLYFGTRSFDGDGDFVVGRPYDVGTPAVVLTETGEREILIEPGPGGAFITKATLDGASIDMLVDTGASFTTLTERDANRLGIYPARAEFTKAFSTANGQVLAAPAEVRLLELGPATVHDVTVFVLPDDRLEISLLGMNVLRRFGSVSFAPDGLTITVDQ